MNYLDHDPDVVSWGYESVVIPYVSNVRSGKVRRYLPDFLVVRKDRRQLVEVKPSRKLKQVTVRKKLAAATLWCAEGGVELVVITEHDLVGMGLL
jgi:hypothetical protein